MLPEFPKFKKLELADKQYITATSRWWPCYSDFNFSSMWAWDINGDIMVSAVDHGLILRFSDYITSKPFYSFIGGRDANSLASKLLQLSKGEGIEPTLKLIPSVVAEQLDPQQFSVAEDPDNDDYVWDVETVKIFNGSAFANKRNYVKQFLKKYKFEFKEVDFESEQIGESLKDLYKTWAERKNIAESYETNEYKAFVRAIDQAQSSKMILTVIIINEKCEAFWLIEPLDEIYGLSHFEKANTQYTGIYPYLVNETAKVLSRRGLKYVNMEQDLGLIGLRENKKSYCPSAILKKYIVTPKF